MPKATITCNTMGSEIRYTVDNSEVTEESPLFSSEIDIEAGATVKAKAFKMGMNPSSQVQLKSLDKLQSPSVSLSRNGATINITLGNTVSGATYRYKVGSAPTSPTDGTAISGSGTLDNSSAVTIYVVGWYTGHYNPSDAGSGSVEQYIPTLQTPTLSLSRSGSTVNGSIGNTVSGATYVYKIGSQPSSQSDGTVISGTSFSFSNSNAVTVYVRGFMAGYNPSSAVSGSVTQYVPPTPPTPTFPDFNLDASGSTSGTIGRITVGVQISSMPSGGTLSYTANGSFFGSKSGTLTESSGLYGAVITGGLFNEEYPVTIRVTGSASGYNSRTKTISVS